MSHSALVQLTRHDQERHQAALEWKAAGGKVVGCLGTDTPEELILAAGFHAPSSQSQEEMP